MASKRDQFLNACRNSKLDTVRWGLGAGGQTPGTRDDDGVTAIMLCALANKHKALQMLLDNCRRSRMKEPIDFVDGEGEGRTALMMSVSKPVIRLMSGESLVNESPSLSFKLLTLLM